MAQRMIHYLFGELLSESAGMKDKERFLLGSLLPDAYSGNAERDAAHFIKRDGQTAIFDFARFRADFGEYIVSDGLYLGYYMHLVEDAFYRKFIAGKGIRKPDSAEGIAFLHKDYHILNGYIVRKYGLKSGPDVSADITGEAINSVARFDAKRLINDIKADFRDDMPESTTYLTTASVDEFVEEYLPLAKEELTAVLSGRSLLEPEDYMYFLN